MRLPVSAISTPTTGAARNAIFAKWRDVARRYGFVEYDGPPLEPLDLFTKKSGRKSSGSSTTSSTGRPRGRLRPR